MSTNIESNDGKKSYIIQSSLWYFVTQIILVLLGLFSVWVSGNFINSYDMGLISILTLFYSIGSTLSLYLPNGIIRYLSLYVGKDDKVKIQELVNLSFVIYLFIILITSILIPILIFFTLNFMKMSIELIIFLILIFSVNLLHIFTYLKIFVNSFKHYLAMTIVSFISTSLGTLISIFIIIGGFSIIGFISRWIFINLIGIIVLIIVCIKFKLPLLIKSLKLFSFKEILKFAYPSFLSGISSIIILNFFVKLSLGGVFGLDQLGYYEFGLKILNIFMSLMTGFIQIIYIHFTSEYGTKGIIAIKENLTWSLRFNSFFLLFLLYATLIFSYPLFSIFLPLYIPSLLYVNGILIFQVINMIFNPFACTLFALGKNLRINIADIIGQVGLLCIFLFLPFLNIYGIIIGYATYQTLNFIIILLFTRKYVNIKPYMMIPLKIFLKTFPLLVIGLLLFIFLNQIYFIPINFFIIILLSILWIRYGKLIREKDIDLGLSFLPEKIRVIIKKVILTANNN
ncbi:MAG: hypothetical protein EAX96_07350 [Candidatus Lokiarchaeota archaeon]|nr:hypothetical protein [Candidatus Lokiarchaeota archaeon]